MAEYTPTTDGILAAWRHFRLDHDLFGKANHGRGVESLDAEVLRWLADHDRQVAERTAQAIAGMQGDYLPSPGLDPAWIAGWRAAMRHAASKIARADALAPRPAAPGVSVSAEQVDEVIDAVQRGDNQARAYSSSRIAALKGGATEAEVAAWQAEWPHRDEREFMRPLVLAALGVTVTDGGA